MNKYYCDTNFIIRYLLRDNEEMFIKTKSVFDGMLSGNTSIILEQTVFTEIVFVLSSYYKIPKTKICDVLSNLLIHRKIICEDKHSLLNALKIYEHKNLHIVDCILIAKSKTTKVQILSFDERLNAYVDS